MLTITPTIIAAIAVPSEPVDAWICDPMYSHPTGTPTQSTIPPPSMMR